MRGLTKKKHYIMDDVKHENGQRRQTRVPLRKLQEPPAEEHDRPELTVPEPPAELTGRALDLYCELIPQLAGRIGYHDWPLIACYCVEMARYWECQSILERDGMTLVTHSGYSQQRPEVSIGRNALAAAKGIAEMFGFSPLSRKRLTGPGSPKTRRK
jgi:P27 family predicted phage terminase small subunit